MPSSFDQQVDITLLGGGISGLWLLALLRSKGYSCILLEKNALGGQQTIASQGILHGGIKFALGGAFSDASKIVGDMPERWRLCLEGNGEINLGQVKQLASEQLLWTTQQIGSRLAGFFSGKAMRGRMKALGVDEYPPAFKNPAFKGSLYGLQETVIEVPSLIACLIKLSDQRLVGFNTIRFDKIHETGVQLTCDGFRINTRRVILTAGQGNEGLLNALGQQAPAMQLRPLHMVMLRGNLPELYGHCLGNGAVPRVTITRHETENGQAVWYLGGGLAESGVKRSASEQIAYAAAELQEVLSWVSLKQVEWSTHRVQRAEIRTLRGGRPDGMTVHHNGSVMTVWPTKLVLMPAVGDRVLQQLEQQEMFPLHPEFPLTPASEPITCRAVAPWQQVKQAWQTHG